MKSLNRLDTSLLIVRIILGFVIASHGAQKLLGWFGGYGFDGTMLFFTGTIGLPYVFALLIILAESIGMIALIFGLFTRFLSGAVILIMAGAIFTTHLQYGFFMNWSGTLEGEGIEFHLLVIALSAVTFLNGAGTYAVDHVLDKKFAGKRESTKTILG